MKTLVNTLNIDYIGYNKDFTPYSIKRDLKIEKLAKSMNVNIISLEDYTLHKFESSVLNNPTTKTYYKKFTPFYNNILNQNQEPLPVVKVIKFIAKKLSTIEKNLTYSITIDEAYDKFLSVPNRNLILFGGRSHAKQLLKLSKIYQQDYTNSRNDLSVKTSQMSAYLKYGCISIREVYFYWKRHFGLMSDLIRQLYWREFYAYILFKNPKNLGSAMNDKYDRIKWNTSKNSSKLLQAWKDGKTGFPVVDAGMRQLNETGYMHNRARLIVASFLVKTLFIDWREGEKYFAQKLLDYDVASNNGNWQWIAGSGVDSQPYFRIFNPWNQSSTHDPECVYIKTFVKELDNVPSKHIHEWYNYHKDYSEMTYPKPIVEYTEMKDLVLMEYKKALE